MENFIFCAAYEKATESVVKRFLQLIDLPLTS